MSYRLLLGVFVSLSIVQSGYAASEAPKFQNANGAYFPIIAYNYPQDRDEGVALSNTDALMDMQSAGFNVVLQPMCILTAVDVNTAYKYGLMTIASADRWNNWFYLHQTESQNPPWLYTPSKWVDGTDFTSKIDELKGCVGLAGYGTWDECMAYHRGNPDSYGDYTVLADAKNTCIKVRDTNPHHYVFYNEIAYDWGAYHMSPAFSTDDFRAWSQIGDASSQDRYPVEPADRVNPVDTTFPNCNLELIGYNVDKLKAINIDVTTNTIQKPVYFTLQGQGWMECDSSRTWTGRRPNFTETRFMAYDSIIHGVNGIGYWGQKWIEPSSSMWLDIKTVTGEIRDLRDVLNTGVVSSDYTLSSTDIHAMMKIYKGKKYLIVANKGHYQDPNNPTSQLYISSLNNVIIIVPGWSSSKAEVLYEGRRINVSNGSFTDSFGPWDVHVYTDNAAKLSHKNDFDGDKIADIVYYSPSECRWHVCESSTAFTSDIVYAVGTPNDMPLSGDFDGDGIDDLVNYTPGSPSVWRITKSSSGFSQSFQMSFGNADDKPLIGDYDGDAKADPAYYCQKTHEWHIKTSSNNWSNELVYKVGGLSDLPLEGDFDGDGKSDLVLLRRGKPSVWTIYLSSENYDLSKSISHSFGTYSDLPLTGDFDGDGLSDMAYFSQSQCRWHLMRSMDNWGADLVYFEGGSSDIPLMGDYDGDGKNDMITYRPGVQPMWWVLKSTESFQRYTGYVFGNSDGLPLSIYPYLTSKAKPDALSVIITLDTYIGNLALTPVNIQVLKNGALVDNQLITPGDTTFAITYPNLEAGSYTVRAVGAKFLAMSANVDITDGNTTATTLSLSNGDLNGDGRIDMSDFAIIKKNWDTINQ